MLNKEDLRVRYFIGTYLKTTTTTTKNDYKKFFILEKYFILKFKHIFMIKSNINNDQQKREKYVTWFFFSQKENKLN